MNPLAVTKARSRLRVASDTVKSLATCKDYDTFTGLWFTFLTAAKSVYTTLEQGSKISAQSRQWFGGKAQERRNDPLLQYLYQARNDDEHGLSFGAEQVPGNLAIGVNQPGYSTAMTINSGPDGTLHVASMDNKPVLIAHTPPHVKLIRVHGRSHEPYDPPENHNGVHLADRSPFAVARIMIDYLESLINEAGSLA